MVRLAWPFLSSRQSEVRQRLIFALDVASMAEVKEYVSLLKDEVGLFKVGKQLFLHGGPQVVRFIHNKGGEVFLDLKFHDIPRTVARTGVEATRLGVRMFDLHASGSSEMMHQTLVDVNKVCRTESLRRPKILAVTVLTSLNKDDLKRIGVVTGVENQVVRLAKLAQEAGMDGVVASPWKSPVFAVNAARICCWSSRVSDLKVKHGMIRSVSSPQKKPCALVRIIWSLASRSVTRRIPARPHGRLFGRWSKGWYLSHGTTRFFRREAKR